MPLFLCCCSVSYETGYVSFYFVAMTDKVLSIVLVGKVNGPYYCLLGWTLMSLVFTDSSH
jgi:hypothetical protein